MNAPFTADADLLSDSLASLKHAVYGATTAPIGKTLSEEYIAKLSEEDRKYISPDKQVDLSTCVAPDRVWILKNAHHDVFDCLIPVIYAFLNGTNENVDTVYKKVGLKQCMVYDYETNKASNMTEDNCAEYEFLTRSVEKPTTETRLVSFMRFFTMIFKILQRIFSGNFEFSDILN